MDARIIDRRAEGDTPRSGRFNREQQEAAYEAVLPPLPDGCDEEFTGRNNGQYERLSSMTIRTAVRFATFELASVWGPPLFDRPPRCR